MINLVRWHVLSVLAMVNVRFALYCLLIKIAFFLSNYGLSLLSLERPRKLLASLHQLKLLRLVQLNQNVLRLYVSMDYAADSVCIVQTHQDLSRYLLI